MSLNVFVFGRLVAKSEDVQYMRFDKFGNLYLYEPGAGMSGEPKRVIEFGSDEIVYANGGVESNLKQSESVYNKFGSLPSSNVHRIIPCKADVITKVADNKIR